MKNFSLIYWPDYNSIFSVLLGFEIMLNIGAHVMSSHSNTLIVHIPQTVKRINAPSQMI